MNNISFLSTVYPGVEKYIDEFLKSLSRQIYKNFDILLLNDGIENCEERLKGYDDLNIIILHACGTTA